MICETFMRHLNRTLPACVILTVLLSFGDRARAREPMTESYICIEAETGMVVLEQDADLVRPPASMLKMMQMLLVEEGVEEGKWRYDQTLRASARAAATGGTQVFLKEGEERTLDELMNAIAVTSANDASVVVAEGLWGSVDNCLDAMNRRAAELGMVNTHFYSVHGLPPADGESFDQSSARDMAILGRALTMHPEIMRRTSLLEFQFRPGESPRKNTNELLEQMPGCDGLKTGYIRAAGFCLAGTAVRNDIRLIAVVMGSDKRGRFSRTREVLEAGFERVRRVEPIRAGVQVGKPVPVYRGVASSVSLVSRENLAATVLADDVDRLVLEFTAPTRLEAPVAAHTEVGVVRLMLDDHVLGETSLLTGGAIELKPWFRRILEWPAGVAAAAVNLAVSAVQ